MPTQSNPPFSITAKFLGPVQTLNGTLTGKRQNLIFARNGTGKSFLSRACRYLDLYGQGEDISDAPESLISDESYSGSGEFSVSRGANVLGSLKMAKSGKVVNAQTSETIFHVFSEDFVQKELRDRMYEIDGNIENQISVDSDKIKMTEANDAITKAQKDIEAAISTIKNKFESKKLLELSQKGGVNKKLAEYQSLLFDTVLRKFKEKPSPPEKSFHSILSDLDSIKALPPDPIFPSQIGAFRLDNLDISLISESISKVTSPSSVANEIKTKIESHKEFYEVGTQLAQHQDNCPFCEQSIQSSNVKPLIESFIKYFTDEEERHKSELRLYYKQLQSADDKFKLLKEKINGQKRNYDILKSFVPSKKESNLESLDELLRAAQDFISEYKAIIEKKAKNLNAVPNLIEDTFGKIITDINKALSRNDSLSEEIEKVVRKSDNERKQIQRTACSVFEIEFAIDCWAEIDNIRIKANILQQKEVEKKELERLSPSTNAKTRVIETFENLLREFFGNKYLFDRENFTLTRGDVFMSRGAHRTLSDGEKTAIAFCYFIACTHKKVKNNSDYKNLYFVFDDPITSMSYDFVFAIAQTLKNIVISREGDITTNRSLLDGNKYNRPNILILTHSSYFYNISVTNKVVENDAAFSLHTDGKIHKLSLFNKYVAPFEWQLREVYEVAHGKSPEHSTGNSIRSVLEAVGRFCHPDKCDSLTNFITFLTGESDIVLKSVLINNLCHGTYYEETPSPEDVQLACVETLQVVEKYAGGQLNLIRKAATPPTLKVVASAT